MKIQLQGLSGCHPAAKTGAAPALHAVSLEVVAGEQVAIIGPSGADCERSPSDRRAKAAGDGHPVPADLRALAAQM